MKESSTLSENGGSPQERIKLHKVRIQLPLVDSSTQTENNYIFPPIMDKGDSLVSYPNNTIPQMPSQEKISLNEVHLTPLLPSYEESLKDREALEKEDKENSDISNGIRRQKSEISSYVIALRPWSFPASFTPVALGSCLAYKYQGVFDISIFITTIFTALCVHAAGNLVNTYFDYVRGIDTKKSDDRTIVDNILPLNDVATLGAVFYVAGCAGFMFLNILSPAKMEHLALVYFCGLSSSFLYTGGLGLKYIAMGDILIVLTFGPLTVVFSHLSQTGQLSLTPLLYALPLALNTEAILHCNNARDMEVDKQAGIITLAILLGVSGSYILFCLLLFIPYLLFFTVGINYSKWMFLPAASIFLAFRLEKQFRRRDLSKMPQKVATLNLILGILYILSILLSNNSTLPNMTDL